MANIIQFPQQPLFNIPRNTANINFQLSLINGEIRFSTEQGMQLLNINASTFVHHSDAIDAEETRGSIPSNPLYDTYQIPVFIQSTSDTGRGGGTQLMHFHHPKKLFKMATRTRNTPHKSEVMEWLINLGNEVIQQGFVIDQHALQHDPNVVVRLNTRANVYNYTQARHDMADQNKSFLGLITRCYDAHDTNGQLLNSKVSYCQQRMHNTAHVSVHGMTAKQLVYTRINAQDPFLGQITFAGQYCPIPSEYNNACNYMNEQELVARTSTVYNASSRLWMHLDTIINSTPVSVSDMLKMFTYGCSGGYSRIPHISTDYRDYSETAINSIVNMPNRQQANRHIREQVELFEQLHPNRKSLTHYELGMLQRAEQLLGEACIDNSSLYDDSNQQVVDSGFDL